MFVVFCSSTGQVEVGNSVQDMTERSGLIGCYGVFIGKPHPEERDFSFTSLGELKKMQAVTYVFLHSSQFCVSQSPCSMSILSYSLIY
jgi:hypothetical protein